MVKLKNIYIHIYISFNCLKCTAVHMHFLNTEGLMTQTIINVETSFQMFKLFPTNFQSSIFACLVGMYCFPSLLKFYVHVRTPLPSKDCKYKPTLLLFPAVLVPISMPHLPRHGITILGQHQGVFTFTPVAKTTCFD